MPLEAKTHAVHSGIAMPPLAEIACLRSGICTPEKVRRKDMLRVFYVISIISRLRTLKPTFKTDDDLS